jgi:hypothetical protein
VRRAQAVEAEAAAEEDLDSGFVEASEPDETEELEPGNV